MLRALAFLAVAGCASGVCETCPSVTLMVNGTTELTAPTGTPLTYTWSSTNADAVHSTVTVSPTSPDACGIQDGPWVVDTLAGTSDPVALAPCQSGFTYTLGVTVIQRSSGATATAEIIVAVP